MTPVETGGKKYLVLAVVVDQVQLYTDLIAKVAYKVQQWKLLCNGLLLLQLQLYDAGANDTKISIRMVESLWRNI